MIIITSKSKEKSPSWEAGCSLADQEFSALYGTWKFITMLTGRSVLC
jgi:hypothetical protein